MNVLLFNVQYAPRIGRHVFTVIPIVGVCVRLKNIISNDYVGLQTFFFNKLCTVVFHKINFGW